MCIDSVDIGEESAAVQHLLTSFRANAHTTFIGSGELIVHKALQQLAFSLNVSGVVTIAGAQEPARVIGYMQQADVLVNPIVRGTHGLVRKLILYMLLPTVLQCTSVCNSHHSG